MTENSVNNYKNQSNLPDLDNNTYKKNINIFIKYVSMIHKGKILFSTCRYYRTKLPA